MAEITLEGDASSKPIPTIGVEPLGKLLVQLLINPEQYEDRRKKNDGHDLDPIPCASSRELAYKFRPEIQVQAKPGNLKVQRKSVVVPIKTGTSPNERIVGGERVGGKTDEHIDPEALLPGASNPQVVSYWRHCTKEQDLTEHFQPDSIVDMMRPAEISEDRLGLLKRLRVVTATYLSLADRLSQPSPPTVGAETLAAVQSEKKRLQALLVKVRKDLLEKLSKDKETQLDDDRILELTDSARAFGLLEKQRERRRLEAIQPKQS